MALSDPRVVVLAGGVGGAKLAHGMAQILPPDRLTVIVNTGDDFWHYGLRICPDLDTVMYTLAGLVNPATGWGLNGDTQAMLGALRRLGDDPWFGLGDQDLATHLVRTRALHAGQRLTTVTAALSRALGVQAAILPMSDQPVATQVNTRERGWLEFQEYFVRYRWQPVVTGLNYSGSETAQATDWALAALEQADVIVLAPSNPWLSIAPILSVTPYREALIGSRAPRIAVTPIIGGQAVKGPAAKLMAELGYEVSPGAVAAYYDDVITGFVYDLEDQAVSVPTTGRLAAQTYMRTEADRAALAQTLLDWAASGGAG